MRFLPATTWLRPYSGRPVSMGDEALASLACAARGRTPPFDCARCSSRKRFGRPARGRYHATPILLEGNNTDGYKREEEFAFLFHVEQAAGAPTKICRGALAAPV